jgi:hypothetical protein
MMICSSNHEANDRVKVEYGSIRSFPGTSDKDDGDGGDDAVEDDDGALRADGTLPPPPSMSARTTTTTNLPVLVTAFAAALATGAPTYAFGLYGATLKRNLHLSQSQLNAISSANFCAGLLSWIPGLAVDAWGPAVAMMVGGTVEAAALLAYWAEAQYFSARNDPVLHHYHTATNATTTATSPDLSIATTIPACITVPVLSLTGVVIFMSNSLVIGSLFKLLVVSCGNSRGSAVGAAKGYVGLGAGAYSTLFDSLHRPSDLDFLPMAAVLALLTIVLPAATLIPRSQHELDRIVPVATEMHYRTIYVGLAVLAVLVVGTNAAFLFLPHSHSSKHSTTATDPSGAEEEEGPNYLRGLIVLLAWLVPILSLAYIPYNVVAESENDTETIHILESQRSTPSSTCKSPLSSTRSQSRTLAPEHDYSLTEMLQTTTAWNFLFTCTVLVGSGTIMTNNMGQMVSSRGLPARTTAACLSMFSVAQSFARVFGGSISEYASTWNVGGIWNAGVPRPSFLLLACVLGAAAHATLAGAMEQGTFVIGVVLSGFCFGLVWPLMVLMVGEIFGTTNHGANYMFFDGFTSAVGTLILSGFMASVVYESNIDRTENPDEITCYGVQCYQLTHLITAGLCLVSLFTSVGVMALTKNLYNPTITRHLSAQELFGSPYEKQRKVPMESPSR